MSDVGSLAVTKAKYTMICQRDGGMLDDLIVYRLGEQRYLIVANASNTDVVVNEVRERAARFAAHVEDVTLTRALIAVQGPTAAVILTTLTDTPLETVRYYSATEAKVNGCAALVARTGYTGEDGFELMVDASDASAVWQAVSEAGDAFGLALAGLACRDTLRLEAGMPLYGHELSARLTPFDVGMTRLVHLDDDREFVGRAALEIAAGQSPRRKLVGLVGASRRVPRAGYAVRDPSAGAPIGEVTSGAPSPSLRRPIAMASVDAEFAPVGATVHIDIRGNAEPAVVVDLPFYRRGQ